MHVRFSLSIAALGYASSATALADFRAGYAIVKSGRTDDMPGMGALGRGR